MEKGLGWEDLICLPGGAPESVGGAMAVIWTQQSVMVGEKSVAGMMASSVVNLGN
jgi:hypothetical protein